MAVAEIASDDPVGDMVAYTEGPQRYHTAYSFIFLREAFGAAHFRQALEAMRAASGAAKDGAWPSWAFSNHDVPRVATRWGNTDAPPAFAKLMIALLVCLRGTTFLYQGEELGLPQARLAYEDLRDPEGIAFWPDYESRDNARTPMPWRADAPHAGFSDGRPWLPVDDRHVPLAVDRQDEDPVSPLHFTRRFLAWRKDRRPLVDGEVRFLDTEEPVLAFERTSGSETILCVFNLGPQPADIVLSGAEGAVPFEGLGLDGHFGDGRAWLPGHGAVFAAMP